MTSSASTKTGVLLVNLGTPEQATASSIRAFLREFLSDHRVVEIPRVIWLSILYLFILPFRPKKLVHSYQSIWTDEGSPLLSIAYKQQKKLEQAFVKDDNILFQTAMSYGKPSIKNALEYFQQQGVDKLIVLPLYPQYSGSTTASVFDQVTQVLQKWRNIPDFTFVKHYYNHPLYIKALADSVRSFRQQRESNGKNDKLLISFHGIPIDYCTKGDPYDKECEQTASLLAKELALDENQWTMSYQSLFGKAEWLKPYTSEHLKSLAKDNIDNLDVICPGFSNDCLETLEEIKIENKGYYKEAGGGKYDYISALNDSDDHIKMMQDLINNNL